MNEQDFWISHPDVQAMHQLVTENTDELIYLRQRNAQLEAMLQKVRHLRRYTIVQYGMLDIPRLTNTNDGMLIKFMDLYPIVQDCLTKAKS